MEIVNKNYKSYSIKNFEHRFHPDKQLFISHPQIFYALFRIALAKQILVPS